MPRTQTTKKNPATAIPAPAAPIPAPSTAARPRGFRLGELTPAQRPDDDRPIVMQGWLSPDASIAVQYTTAYRETDKPSDRRYVVSVIVNGRAWVVTHDTYRAGWAARYHTASTIKALAYAIWLRVAADPAPWQALQTARVTKGHTVAPRAVEAFRKQIADLIDR